MQSFCDNVIFLHTEKINMTAVDEQSTGTSTLEIYSFVNLCRYLDSWSYYYTQLYEKLMQLKSIIYLIVHVRT